MGYEDKSEFELFLDEYGEGLRRIFVNPSWLYTYVQKKFEYPPDNVADILLGRRNCDIGMGLFEYKMIAKVKRAIRNRREVLDNV